ncbi:carboxypeptidase-like regulatory domain-containing protein [Fulvivirga maritima]|uniref:carboxypeptidase-like regulatory domain-containing protein n=1 Tax=Fulvivirga maritima TaxID=2904247 RepID=UPI001F1DF790|nr:carboxypeptidase-like regulatory domain-containing protein [Fulvivirga maritima]UII25633.1 carboxypeptidase-like regulatory domain-containing protein [Fulvivirga maritima]
MKRFIIFHFLISLCITCFSQEAKFLNIQGQVKDENNAPIANAHITIPGRSIGTITNQQGFFNLLTSNTQGHIKVIVTHINYQIHSEEFNPQKTTFLKIELKDRIYQLEEVVIQHSLSAHEIVTKAIKTLESNFQIDSITYTLFTRYSENIQESASLIEEFAFDIYHDEKSKPEFKISKIRAKALDLVGKKRLNNQRLITLHKTEGHIMLRYIPHFLQLNKMKKYNYSIIDETYENENAYYIISIESDRYQKGGIIHVNKNDFGISYIQKITEDEHWKNESRLNRVRVSHYQKVGDKYFFTHGYSEETLHLKQSNMKINLKTASIVIDRANQRNFIKKEEMGLMSQKTTNFLSDFNDPFWKNYGNIPLEKKYEY